MIQSVYFPCKCYCVDYKRLRLPPPVPRSQSERNPWVALTSALLTRCQGSEVKLDLGRQVVAMVRSLYNTKHKLPAPVSITRCRCDILERLVSLKASTLASRHR